MIAVAISGGVDSAFTAWLLSRRNRVFLLHALFVPEEPDLERPHRLAEFLGLPLKIVDLRRPFEEKIIRYFREAYARGLTPNPCVLCNREIKFGLLLKEALRLGAERLATGHYARVRYHPDLNRYLLYKGRDPAKDQSYFLHQLSQEALARVLFPLGDYLKEEVIREAVRIGLFPLTAPESQEVCFIRGDYRELFRGLDFPPGEIVTVDGRVVGRHRGLYAYTVGQRRGLGLRLGKPYYVVRLDPRRNRVIVGEKKHLLVRSFLVGGVNFIYPVEPGKPFRAEVRIRYRHREAPAEVRPWGPGVYRVIWEKPQRAVTPGQFAVFYQGELVLGGGEILPEEDDAQD
ncbi:tRNA 2-thiouridine(34) synthase MnmA [Thermosulfurimonas sp.]|uniref:tRNA 2-thiouridine(34) synthase MnmA n=1 Tax=Thermosulfurimonas sp. TaxID=2080236 RepID=UPI0025D49BF7|nr:tRNA 2-thiouridine(34) synthase MnmA [Thermosulfurimonas sp.]